MCPMHLTTKTNMLTQRTMRWEEDGVLLYCSAFSMKTGSIARMTVEAESYSLDAHLPNEAARERFNKKYGYLTHAKSPVPETIDVRVTNACKTGCAYCYMNSTPGGEHMDMSVLEALFNGLDQPPYQIAIGGGEPALHPRFTDILKYIRERECIPSYTTAGTVVSQEIFDATNKYCGGVALTYHRAMGKRVFTKLLDTWRDNLDYNVTLNIHVIFDQDGPEALRELGDILSKRALNETTVVLLAYYPNVGRSTFAGVPDKDTYMHRMPRAIRAFKSRSWPVSEIRLACSEGLLPFFNSRPDLLDTSATVPMEGRFSCYVDNNGNLFHSSFDTADPRHGGMNITKERFQDLWWKLRTPDSPISGPCDRCHAKDRCHAPHYTHRLMCAHQDHNKGA